jgi:acyl carrier protein
MPSTDDDLVPQVCSVVARTLDLALDLKPLDAQTQLLGRGLGVDSVDALRLVAALEEEFDVTIEDIDLIPSNFERVESIVTLLHRLRA